MRVLVSFITFVLVCVSLAAQEVLTDESILKMLKAGLEESVVIDMVRTRPGDYQLTTDRLVELKRLGVPPAVLLEMMKKSRPSPPNPIGDEPPAATNVWAPLALNETAGPETSVTAASRVMNAARGARIEVTASCVTGKVPDFGAMSSQAMGALFSGLPGMEQTAAKLSAEGKSPYSKENWLALKFELNYLPAAGSQTQFVVLKDAPTGRARVDPMTNTATVTMDAQLRCISLGVAVDDFRRDGFRSCTGGQTARLVFPNRSLVEMMSGTMTDSTSGPGLQNIVQQYFKTVAGGTEIGVSLRQALEARRVSAMIPLTDGTTAQVTVDTSDPSYRSFVAKCRAAFGPGIDFDPAKDARTQATKAANDQGLFQQAWLSRNPDQMEAAAGQMSNPELSQHLVQRAAELRGNALTSPDVSMYLAALHSQDPQKMEAAANQVSNPIMAEKLRAAAKATRDRQGGSTIPSPVAAAPQGNQTFADGERLARGGRYAEAAAVFRQLSSQGNADAMADLGQLYYHGWGVAQSDAEAIELYRKAADGGSSKGMGNLAIMYALGRATAVNAKMAAAWAEKGAAGGDVPSMILLGVLYENGSGVPRDLAAAKTWYQKAASLGSADAQKGLQRLGGR